MKKKYNINIFCVAMLSVALCACQSKVKGNDASIMEDSVEIGVSTVDYPEGEESSEANIEYAMKAFVQSVYDDILPMYNAGRVNEIDAFKKYASTRLLSLFADIDSWSAENEEAIAILGWDCDPWIMAQDWSHLDLNVLDAETLSNTKGKVEVEILNGNDKTPSTLILVLENDQWKVDDFAPKSLDNAKTYYESLKQEFEAAKK